MKEKKCNTCPGCRRHCAEGSARCGYGCRYFEKKKKQEMQNHPENACRSKHQYKWEREVTHGGLAWKLLFVSRRMKKALRSHTVTEQALMNALTDAQKQALSEAIEALNGCIR